MGDHVLAGELLVAGGRPGGGRNLQKLAAPTLADVHDRSRWSGVLRVERAAAARKVADKRSDLHLLNLDAVNAATDLARAARQCCSSRGGYETLMRVIRGAARRRVTALIDEHGQIDRHRVDERVAATIAAGDGAIRDRAADLTQHSAGLRDHEPAAGRHGRPVVCQPTRAYCDNMMSATTALTAASSDVVGSAGGSSISDPR